MHGQLCNLLWLVTKFALACFMMPYVRYCSLGVRSFFGERNRCRFVGKKSTQVHLQSLQLPDILSRDHCRVQYRVFFASFGRHGLVLAHERAARDPRLFLRVWKPAARSDILSHGRRKKFVRLLPPLYSYMTRAQSRPLDRWSFTCFGFIPFLDLLALAEVFGHNDLPVALDAPSGFVLAAVPQRHGGSTE